MIYSQANQQLIPAKRLLCLKLQIYMGGVDKIVSRFRLAKVLLEKWRYEAC